LEMPVVILISGHVTQGSGVPVASNVAKLLARQAFAIRTE